MCTCTCVCTCVCVSACTQLSAPKSTGRTQACPLGDTVVCGQDIHCVLKDTVGKEACEESHGRRQIPGSAGTMSYRTMKFETKLLHRICQEGALQRTMSEPESPCIAPFPKVALTPSLSFPSMLNIELRASQMPGECPAAESHPSPAPSGLLCVGTWLLAGYSRIGGYSLHLAHYVCSSPCLICLKAL